MLVSLERLIQDFGAPEELIVKVLNNCGVKPHVFKKNDPLIADFMRRNIDPKKFYDIHEACRAWTEYIKETGYKFRRQPIWKLHPFGVTIGPDGRYLGPIPKKG